MKRNQKGLGNTLVIIVVIAVLATLGFYLLKGQTTSPTVSPNQVIQSNSDLTNASNDLDNTDVDATIDSQLKQNDADAQTF